MLPALGAHEVCSVTQYKDRKYLNSIDIAGRIVGSLAHLKFWHTNARPFFSSHTHWTNTKQKHGATRENK